MTQGAGGTNPPPYPSHAMQPEAIPRGSSTFIYTGRSLSSDPPHDDNDEYQEDEITQSMVEMVNMIEQRDTYKAQLDAVQSVLSTVEEALAKSLAREEELKSKVNDARGIRSTHYVGIDSNVNASRRQLGSPSPNYHASTPRIFHHTSPTPQFSSIASPSHHD